MLAPMAIAEEIVLGPDRPSSVPRTSLLRLQNVERRFRPSLPAGGSWHCRRHRGVRRSSPGERTAAPGTTAWKLGGNPDVATQRLELPRDQQPGPDHLQDQAERHHPYHRAHAGEHERQGRHRPAQPRGPGSTSSTATPPVAVLGNQHQHHGRLRRRARRVPQRRRLRRRRQLRRHRRGGLLRRLLLRQHRRIRVGAAATGSTGTATRCRRHRQLRHSGVAAPTGRRRQCMATSACTAARATTSGWRADGIFFGVVGQSIASSGTSYAVFGDSRTATGGTAYAGGFAGNVHAFGTLSKNAGGVQDRPPARPGEQVPVALVRRVAGHDERLQRQRHPRRRRRRPAVSCRTGSRRSTATSATSSRRSARPLPLTSPKRSAATGSGSPAARPGWRCRGRSPASARTRTPTQHPIVVEDGQVGGRPSGTRSRSPLWFLGAADERRSARDRCPPRCRSRRAPRSRQPRPDPRSAEPPGGRLSRRWRPGRRSRPACGTSPAHRCGSASRVGSSPGAGSRTRPRRPARRAS